MLQFTKISFEILKTNDGRCILFIAKTSVNIYPLGGRRRMREQCMGRPGPISVSRKLRTANKNTPSIQSNDGYTTVRKVSWDFPKTK
jgi:hypothetical protein